MAERGVGFARDERGSRGRYRISGADQTGSSREQYWPPRRSRPTGYNQSPPRAVLAKFSDDACEDRQRRVEPVDVVAPRDRESVDGLGGRGPVAGVEAAEEVVVAVGEAIDGMRPESEIERGENLKRKRIVTAVPQFTIVVRFLVLFAWHPRKKMVEMSLRGRFVHRQNFGVEDEVAHSVAVLRPTVPVSEKSTLAIDLVLDDLVGDTPRDEGVERARCRSEFA